MIHFVLMCVLALMVLGGCLHGTPVGADKGIVKIQNMRYLDDDERFINTGVLTGVAISDHIVLTSAHTLGYEPEQDHPIVINGHRVKYEILADGWAGRRDKFDGGDKYNMDMSLIGRDYLFLRSDLEIRDHATLVPLEFERVKEVRHATLVTRDNPSSFTVSIPVRSFTVSRDGEFVLITLRKTESIDPERFGISGSPLIGEYSDGTLVLIGIASASGSAFFGSEQLKTIKEDQIFFTPAYRIPWEEIVR